MSLTHPLRQVLALSLLGLLSACGGGESSSSSPVHPPKPSPNPITALNGLSTSAVNKEVLVDMAPFILGDKEGLIMKVDNEDASYCPEAEVHGLTFKVTATEAGWCDYRYQVHNSKGQHAQAQMTLVTSTSVKPLLPTIPVTAKANSSGAQSPIVIDLIKATGLTGYQLIHDRVSVQAPEGIDVGTITTSENSISYLAPSQFGWNDIQYALTKVLADGTIDTRIGYIFVTISDSINNPPSINPPIFHYPKVIEANKTIKIDLGFLQNQGLNITDDSGEWQLVGVKAIGANLALAEPESTENKAFFFTANKGDYDVSYVIADHDNGFSFGVISLTVGMTKTKEALPVCPKQSNDATHSTQQCLTVTADNSGNWFSASPSQHVLKFLGYLQALGNQQVNKGKTYTALQQEMDATGAMKSFALFDQRRLQTNQEMSSQYARWCQQLADIKFAGTNKWRRVTQEELDQLKAFAEQGVSSSVISPSKGWPTVGRYWTESYDANKDAYATLSLEPGISVSHYDDHRQAHYATCVAIGAGDLP